MNGNVSAQLAQPRWDIHKCHSNYRALPITCGCWQFPIWSLYKRFQATVKRVQGSPSWAQSGIYRSHSCSLRSWVNAQQEDSGIVTGVASSMSSPGKPTQWPNPFLQFKYPPLMASDYLNEISQVCLQCIEDEIAGIKHFLSMNYLLYNNQLSHLFSLSSVTHKQFHMHCFIFGIQDCSAIASIWLQEAHVLNMLNVIAL